MKLVYSENYNINLTGHPWDTGKYKRIIDRLLAERQITPEAIVHVDWADDEDILRVHTLDYVEKMNDVDFSADDERRLELPITYDLIRLFWTFAQGTITACQLALDDRIAVHIGGGMHHAFPAYGTGFCMVNDLAVAAKTMLATTPVSKIVIIDCDLHQGDGTAKIFSNNPDVFTFSIHQRDLFPYPKQDSDYDIALPNGVGDEDYLTELENALTTILADNGPFDLVIYQAGSDPYAGDPLGSLELTIDGLRKRDELIIAQALQEKIPLAITLGGGYSDKVVDIHCNMIEAAMSMLKQC